MKVWLFQYQKGAFISSRSPRGRPHCPLIGAGPGEAVMDDTLSIKMFQALLRARSIQMTQVFIEGAEME
jgi:kynureninase